MFAIPDEGLLPSDTLLSLLPPLFFVFKFFIEVWLNYNVVLITAVQQSDSVLHVSTLLFHILFIMVYLSWLKTQHSKN